MTLRRVEKLAILAWVAVGLCGCASAPILKCSSPPDPAAVMWRACLDFCAADDQQDVRRVEVKDFEATCVCRRMPDKT